MSDPNDVTLAAAGDYDAFERLYRENVSEIYSLCARLSASRGRATTLTQEVFVKAWEQISGFDGDAEFGVWLRRLAAEVVLEREGMVGGRSATPELDTSTSEGQSDSRGISDSGPLELSQALASLPPSARGIFVLHDVEGYQHQDIAELFGITVGASKARLQRARVLLIQAMGR